MLDFSSIEMRAFAYVLGQKEKKVSGLVPANEALHAEYIEKRTQGYWPPIHPVNLAFQEEIKAKGMVGPHGFPKVFLEKLLTGSMFNTIDLSSGPAPPTTAAEPEQPKEEIFDLYLKGYLAEGKIKLIKELKDMMNLGLKEAKDRLEAASTTPILLAKRVKPESQEALVEKMKGLGGEVEFVKVS
jgi:large subunit ribosomal protein L7/L12